MKAIIFRVFSDFRCSMVQLIHVSSRVFPVEKLFEMITSLSQYEAQTIFHVFVGFVQRCLVNRLNALSGVVL